MNIPVRFGIIGCGMISKFHINAIQAIDGAELAGVYDANTQAAIDTAAIRGCKAYSSIQAMLTDPTIEAVSICTPSGLHAVQALEAIQCGKHVLIEKPIAFTLDEIDRIATLAKEKKIKVGAVSQLRFAPAIQKLKQAVDDGLLGRIVCGDMIMKYYRSQEYYVQTGWRGTLSMDGGGALMNQGIHGVDLLSYIMGPVASVTAISKTLVHPIETEDTLCALLDFKSGAVGVIQAMVSVFPGYPRRLEISGENGTIILEEDRIAKWDVKGDSIQLDARQNETGSHHDPSMLSDTSHVEQYLDFIRGIREGAELFIGTKEARETLEIISSAYQSAKENCTVYL